MKKILYLKSDAIIMNAKGGKEKNNSNLYYIYVYFKYLKNIFTCKFFCDNT